jgi:hypothetical protein
LTHSYAVEPGGTSSVLVFYVAVHFSGNEYGDEDEDEDADETTIY